MRFLVFSLTLLTPFLAYAETSSPGRLFAIVIAASYSESTAPEVTKLPYTLNDADFILEALNRWSSSSLIHRSLLERKDSDLQPTKANIEKYVVEWLKEFNSRYTLNKDDTVLVFFSGHGIRKDDNGQLNSLLPCDFKDGDLQGSSIPVAYLREQLSKYCEAKKVLLLDCCHAGGEGTAASPTEGVIKSLPDSSDALDVITIASCGPNEKSHYWKDQNLSLFSYYLAEALRGEADADGNKSITMDELYRYVHDHVCKTAESLGFSQNPVRIVRSGVTGDPVIAKFDQPPQTLEQLLNDIARKISAKMQEKKINITGTLPFFSVDQDGKTTTGPAEAGLLSNQCTEKLERSLAQHLPTGYAPVRHQMVETALAEHGIKIDEVYSGKMAQAVGTIKYVDSKSLHSFVVGKIKQINKEGLVEISCELTGLPNITALGTFTGRVQLSQAEIAGMGRSLQAPQLAQASNKITAIAPPANQVAAPPISVDPEYRPGLPPSVPVPVLPVSSAALVPLDTEIAKLFRVTVVVKRGNTFRPVQPIQNGDRTFIPLEHGDVYRIRLLNPTSETVMVRVLVDGLNTLPEKIEAPEKVKFVAVATDETMQYIESLKQAGAIIVQDDKGEFYRVAPPSGLDAARPWVLKPHQEVEIPGFFHQVGAGGNYKEFRVTDAPFSVAGRTNFTDQLGLIAVGFFTAVPENAVEKDGKRGVGTGMGYEYRRKVKVNESLTIGGILETQLYYYAPHRDIISSTVSDTVSNVVSDTVSNVVSDTVSNVVSDVVSDDRAPQTKPRPTLRIRRR